MRQLRAVPIALLVSAPLLAAGDHVSQIPEASPPMTSEGQSTSDRAAALLKEANEAFARKAYPQALAAVEAAIELSGETEPLLELEWEIFFRTGDWTRGLPVAVRLEEISKRKSVWGCLRIAEAHAMLGHETEALDWIEKAVRERSFMKVGVFEHTHYDSLRGNPRFSAAVEEAKKNSGVGRVAADFRTRLVDGEEFSLSSLRGRVVLLDFWATWCSPCVESAPVLQLLWERAKGDDFIWVGASVDDDEQAWRNFVKHNRLGGTQLLSPEWAETMGVDGFPTVLLVDRDGMVQCSVHGERIAQAALAMLKK
jgi:thiol-disulfide isomerase/thioredoxin